MQDALMTKFVLICGVLVFWARAAPGNESFPAFLSGSHSPATTSCINTIWFAIMFLG